MDPKLKQFDAGRSVDIQIARAMRFPGVNSPVPAYAVGPQMPPGLQQAGDAPFSRTIYPPWTVKLAESRDFLVNDFQMALPGAIGATISSAASQFQVPESQIGWLQNFALYILAPIATSSVKWTIRINGGPVSGWDNIQNPPGVALFTYIPSDDLQIRLPNHCLVDVLITNRSANPETVGTALGGWYHPSQAELHSWGSIV